MKTDFEILDEHYLAFDEHLDEVLDSVKIGMLEYSPSDVFKSVDPIAYEISFQEWLDIFDE